MNTFVLAVNGILFLLAVELAYSLSHLFGEVYLRKTPVVLVSLSVLGLFYKFVPGLWGGFWQIAPMGFLNYLLIGVYFFIYFAISSIPDPHHESVENFRERTAIIVSAICGVLWLPILMLIVLWFMGEWIWQNVAKWIWRNVIAEIMILWDLLGGTQED